MRIELIKKTMKITGKEYYFVSVDGDNLISATWTNDLEKACQYFKDTIELARQFPEDVETVIETVEI